MFSLIDVKGNSLQSEQLGLVLYQGGTVCNEKFDNKTAEAICRQMGFSSAIKWNTGVESDVQFLFEVAISIYCESVEWEPEKCFPYEISRRESTYEMETETTSYCVHSRDVFLQCTGNIIFRV